MRGDMLVNRQRLMAQAVFALADHIEQSTGYNLKPLRFTDLPTGAALPTGALACINDSTANTWGSIVAGGGGFTVLAFFNGTNWTVAGR